MLLTSVIAVYADDSSLKLQTTSSPASPVEGGNWVFTIFADHPVPEEVNVQPPQFPQGMVLERVRTSIRFIKPQAAANVPAPEPEMWTSLEYLFSLKSSGAFTLGAFSVSAGIKKGVTSPVTFRVTSPVQPAAGITPAVRWEKIPASLVQGQKAEITLALQNWDTSKPAPRSLLRGMVPAGFILEELPFTGPGSDKIIRYPIVIIALETDNFTFNPLTVQVEGVNLQIPKISIQVTQNAEKNTVSAAGMGIASAAGKTAGTGVNGSQD
ncbi:MAG: hypothetical protein FWD78_14695, partial [Treponema sp.]|nr:hypothetical protein [Treponema sp.]